MEWYVYRHDSNKGKIIKYNVINTGVINHLIEMLNQIKKEKGHWCYDDFTAAAMQIYRYYYWGRCEHEIIIKEWVGREAEEKVDVFDQLMLNWDIFVDHLYDYVIELMSSKGEEESEDCPEDCLCHTCAAVKDCKRLNFYSCCGCRKTEDDMVTRCISFVGEDDKVPAANKCEDCQCNDCEYKDTILYCVGCNYCENGDDFIPKGECVNFHSEEDAEEAVEEAVEEKPIIEDCLEDCLCKNCKGKTDCGCVDCSHSVHDIIKSCRSFQRISSWEAGNSQGRWICANCKAPALYWGKDVFLSDFCPHCGASMGNCSCGVLKGMD